MRRQDLADGRVVADVALLGPDGAEEALDQPADVAATRLLRRFWTDYLRVHRGSMAGAFALMTVEGSTLALISWMLKPLFDRVFVGKEEGAIWWVGGAIMAIFVLRAVTLIASRSLLSRISLGISTTMQRDLLAHIMTLDGRFFQLNPPGAMIERIQGDTIAVQGVWATLITGATRDAISLVMLFAVAVNIDPIWTLAALIGGWWGVGLFVWQAFVAIWQLELTNYVEHYGLSRKHLGDGRYEHVMPRHSWNSSHTATNWLLINLQRHSDHHYKPDRRFPLLQTYSQEEAPQLPMGYPAMTFLAMVPPLWRRRMNPRVRAWRRQFYPEIEDWQPYNRGALPMPRNAL